MSVKFQMAVLQRTEMGHLSTEILRFARNDNKEELSLKLMVEYLGFEIDLTFGHRDLTSPPVSREA